MDLTVENAKSADPTSRVLKDRRISAVSAMKSSQESLDLLGFDQIRTQVAAHTRTHIGRELAESLTPSQHLLEIANRQQETAEAKQYLERGGALEFGPGIDLREYIQRALLGGLIRGEELYAIHELIHAARYDRDNLSRHEEFPLLSAYAENIPDLTPVYMGYCCRRQPLPAKCWTVQVRLCARCARSAVTFSSG